jgi:2-polyprenyl-3-methyl-5-hydroxy-6-metoxy-1,4-benzoquinol methylase
VVTSSEAVTNLFQALRAWGVPDDAASFRVLFEEPDTPAVRLVVEAAQEYYLDHLSDKQRVYLESSLPRYKFAVDRLLKYVPVGPARILDVGCAPGYLGILLDTLGYRVHGIDLNEGWFDEYPGREWLGFLNVQACNVEESPLPFPAESFDSVMFTEVLEHIAITDPRRILAELRRVLKPGGYLFLTTPNVANLANVIALARGQNIFWAPEIFYGSTDRHNREYTPDEALAIVSAAGFRIVERFLFNGPNNWNGATASLVCENLQRLRDAASDSPLLGNTIFLVGQPRAESSTGRGEFR